MTIITNFFMESNTPLYGLYLQREDAHEEMLKEDYENFNAKPNFDGILILHDMGDKQRANFRSSEYMTELNKTHKTEMLNYCVMLLFKKEETPEQRAERIFKEDEEKQKERYEEEVKQGLKERQQKRLAVITKYKEKLDAMIVGKQRGICFRRYFRQHVIDASTRIFKTEDIEYNWIGKPFRLPWTDYYQQKKAFNKSELEMASDIMKEFGCFDY